MHRSKLSDTLAQPRMPLLDAVISMMDILKDNPPGELDEMGFGHGKHKWRLTIERLEDGTYDTGDHP